MLHKFHLDSRSYVFFDDIYAKGVNSSKSLYNGSILRSYRFPFKKIMLT